MFSCLTCDRPPPADPGEPGGGASEGGGGAAEPVAGPQPGGERLRGGGRPEDQRGEEVPVPPGAAAEETTQPHGLPGDPPVQQGRGGRDRKYSIRDTGQEIKCVLLLTSVGSNLTAKSVKLKHVDRLPVSQKPSFSTLR